MARGTMAWGVAAVAMALAPWGPRVTGADAAGDAAHPTGAPVPVLVELFTSEGCSSCPPADALLTRLADERTIGGAGVVALAFHVDYWDRLGWKDRFASAAATDRQNRYAAAWQTDRVYTPQAVVDGRIAFVGSDVMQARNALAASAARPHLAVSIALAATDAPGRRTLRVSIDPPSEPGAGAGASATRSGLSGDVLLAIAEDGLSSDVTAGENARQRLAHTGVVRRLTRIGRVTKGTPVRLDSVPAPIDAGWASGRLRAVVFVQDERTREIHGTGQLAF